MSLYIHPENQKILWEIINKSILINNVENIDFIKKQYNHLKLNEKKEQWFKIIIQHFFNLHKNDKLNINTLEELNQKTIKYMITILKENETKILPSNITFTNEIDKQDVNYSYYGENMNISNKIIDKSNSNLTYYNHSDHKNTKELENKYEEIKKEYNAFNNKPIIPELNFKDNYEDKPITNMEELIKEQLNMRNNDIIIKEKEIDKLDIILKKIEDIEKKIIILEQKIL